MPLKAKVCIECGGPLHRKARCMEHYKILCHEAWMKRPGILHIGKGRLGGNRNAQTPVKVSEPKRFAPAAPKTPDRPVLTMIEISAPTDPSKSQSRFNKTSERAKESPAKVQMTEEQRRTHQEREDARKAELLAKARADALERGELANNYIPPHLAAAFERRAQ